MKRHDDLINLLQNILDVLLFHHPTVWWLSRRIRSLREHLADELATRPPGAPRRLDLARALDALDDFQRSQAPEHPSPWALAARGGSLFARIQHLVAPPAAPGRPAWLAPALLALVLPCAALTLKAAVNPPIPGEPALIRDLDALAAREGLDPHLLRSLAWVESGLNRKAKSPAGALGVLQVMPETARRFGARDLDDPEQVATAGAKYLKHLLDRTQGNVAKALAAYSGGEQVVAAAPLDPDLQSYAARIQTLTRDQAIQPAWPLADGEVLGVIERRVDGDLAVRTLVRHRGNIRLVIRPASGKGQGGTVEYGSRTATGQRNLEPWKEQTAKVMIPGKDFGDEALVQCEERGLGWIGETRVSIQGPYRTFRLRMHPAPETAPPPSGGPSTLSESAARRSEAPQS